MKPIFLGSLLLCAIAPPLLASPNYLTNPRRPTPATAFEGGVSLGYDSHYQFNGETFGRDVLWSSVDASLPLSDTSSFSLNATFWDITSPTDGLSREFDLSLALTHELCAQTWISLVGTRYSYQGDLGAETELGLELEHTWRRIDFSLWYGHSLEENGHYVEANLSHTFHVNEVVSLVPSVQVGVASGYEGLGSGLTHLGFRCDIPLEFTDRLSLVPYLAVNLPLHALRSVGLTDDTFYAGIAFHYHF